MSKDKFLSVRLSPQVSELVKEEARSRGLTVSQFIRETLIFVLKERIRG